MTGTDGERGMKMNEGQATVLLPGSEETVDQIWQALQTIVDELAAMRSGAAHLTALYGEAAETSDLTFIKILEEKYSLLLRELQDINGFIEERLIKEQPCEEKQPMEATSDGR
jgi:hypothetical protein